MHWLNGRKVSKIKTMAQIDKEYERVARQQLADRVAKEQAARDLATPAHEASSGYLDAADYDENETEAERRARHRKPDVQHEADPDGGYQAAGKGFIDGLTERGVNVSTPADCWTKYAQSHAVTKAYSQAQTAGPAECDAYPAPGPVNNPSPGQAVTPSSHCRPIITDAHSSTSPGHQSPSLPSVPYQTPVFPGSFKGPLSAADAVSQPRPVSSSPATPSPNHGPRSDSTENHARQP